MLIEGCVRRVRKLGELWGFPANISPASFHPSLSVAYCLSLAQVHQPGTERASESSPEVSLSSLALILLG